MLSELYALSPYLVYVTPPVIGAFIGYLTNRIAIRMLFRPLKQWRIGNMRIPMTPGVIPSKRHQLSTNIGEMVGEQLLTSDEINNALQKDAFQDHLLSLIQTKVTSYMKLELGSLNSIIPSTYKNYFDIGRKTLAYRIKETVHGYLVSSEVQQGLEIAVNRWFDSLLDNEIDELIDGPQREKIIEFFQKSADRIFSDPALEVWFQSLLQKELSATADQHKTCRDILPSAVQDVIINTICNQTPVIQEKASDFLKDTEIQEKIVAAIMRAVDEFIDSMGSMSTMARNFLDMETVEQKIKFYLSDKNPEIDALIYDEDVEVKITGALDERINQLLDTPLVDLADGLTEKQLQNISSQFAKLVVGFVRKTNISQSLSAMFINLVSLHIDNGRARTGTVVEKIMGQEWLDDIRNKLNDGVFDLVRSQDSKVMVDHMVDSLVENLINKPIGRLDHIIPPGVTEGMCYSMREMTTKMLISEVPGIVKSINFKKIVIDKIDSFDLLRLEKLLLSIMQEQFKYINLFGALLGFLIGCVNLIFLVSL